MKRLVTFTPMLGEPSAPMSLTEVLALCGEDNKKRIRYITTQLQCWGFCHTGPGHNVGSVRGTVRPANPA